MYVAANGSRGVADTESSTESTSAYIQNIYMKPHVTVQKETTRNISNIVRKTSASSK